MTPPARAPHFDGQLAQKYAASLSGFHRPLGSDGYRQAANWAAEQLRGFGVAEVGIEHYPAGGKTRVFTWAIPPAWNPLSAALTIVEPRAEPLVRFPDIPTCLLINSTSTPVGGTLGELTDVGVGTRRADYAGKDVRGKIVLGSGDTNLLSELALGEMGAAGIVSDFMVETPGCRQRAQFPEQVCQGTLRSFATRGEYTGFGFSISHAQAEVLRRETLRTRVTLRAEVQAQLGPGEFSAVVARVPGTCPDLELLVVAHLCHPAPGANDNASGVAAAMELARALAAGARQGEPLRASVRFLLAPEFFGTLAYLERHQAELARIQAGICLDQVGEDQEKCGSTLFFERTPDCSPHILNLLCQRLLEQESLRFPGRLHGAVGKFRWQVSRYTGGSDHYPLNDPTIGIPTVLFLNWPDAYYHSQQDTADKLDPAMFDLVGRVVERAVFEVGGLTLPPAMEMLEMAVSDSLCRMAGVAARSGPAGSKARRAQIRGLVEIGERMIDSIKALLPEELQGEFKERTSIAASRLRETADELARLWIPRLEETPAPAAFARVARRTFSGPLYRTTFLRELEPHEKRRWEGIASCASFPLFLDLLLFHADGRRTLEDIVNLIALSYENVPAAALISAAELLASKNFLEFVDRSATG